MEMEKEENEQKAAYLEKLQEMGVNMTRYMLAIRKELVPTDDIIVGPALNEVHLKTNAV